MTQAQPRKKLIEVALPLAKINVAAAREKSIRHGHPSTLHLWWARRPLAACRAVLFASLVDDPDSDPEYRKSDGSVDKERAGLKRAELFTLIEEMVLWENSNNPRVINQARAEIARCVASRKIELGELKKDTVIFGPKKGQAHPRGPVSGEGVNAWEVLIRSARPEVVSAFLADYAPPVLDPFCGGGSIPLEAQRLGLRAYASDLNPVAVLITKALIEIPPKFAGRPPVNPDWQKKKPDEKAMKTWSGAQGLAEDVRYYGRWMRDEAEKRIGHLYPKVKITKEMAEERPDLKEYNGKELTVIAWLWARTIKCPNPACEAVTPISKSFQLSGKKGNESCVEPVVDKTTGTVDFVILPGGGKKRTGNVNRQGASCLVCDSPILLEHIRSEATSGRMGQTLMAIVAEGHKRRVYIARNRKHMLAALEESYEHDAYVPETKLPEHALGFRVQRYGMTTHSSLFSRRQLVALTTFSQLIREACARIISEDGGDRNYCNTVRTYLSFALDKAANYGSSLCSWYVAKEIMVSTFGLPTLSMVWDFAEANPFSDSSGNWMLGVEQAALSLEKLYSPAVTGSTSQKDAATAPILHDPRPIIVTDPPYYDNIGYAALSDFFYVWLRQALSDTDHQLFSTVLTPKDQELIADPGRFGNDRGRAIAHFESGLGAAFDKTRAGASSEYPVSIFYAFKQQETEDGKSGEVTVVSSSGWEKMLAALIAADFTINGTWPIRTEQTGGLREAKRNALASSIILVCRPRPSTAPLATRKQFITALRQELPEALRNLQHGNIAPVDLAQASIGPGMAVFTRYARVMETDGGAMTVRTALGLINQALDEVLAEQEGEFDGDTRWALAWFEQFGMDEGPFGVAETLSKAKNTAVNGLVEAGVVTARGGKVRLVKRNELPDDWDPTSAGRLTLWEAAQHLIHALDQQGESGAAALLHQLGGVAETARDLAYRLYVLCERKKWAEEALAYNGLVIAWPELTKLALAERTRRASPQQAEFDILE